ncbi:hypothetical protein IJI31_05880 [bacterium]|nr:hypothetical protein [bacterium]
MIKKTNPSFSSYNDKVFRDGKLAYRNHTELLRNDLAWNGFMDYVNEKYGGAKEVNVVNHACSAGYESWSLMMMLMKTQGENFKKFMPIKARDLDKNAIEFAKKGAMEICGDEYIDAQIQCGKVLKDNFEIKKRPRGNGIDVSNEYLMTCKTDLGKNIEFKQANIFDDKDLISKENTILFCRNFWPYLEGKKASELAFFLAQNMKPSSTLVIGEYDYAYVVDKLLERTGFKKTNIEYVYEAPGKPAIDKPVDFNMQRLELYAY